MVSTRVVHSWIKVAPRRMEGAGHEAPELDRWSERLLAKDVPPPLSEDDRALLANWFQGAGWVIAGGLIPAGTPTPPPCCPRTSIHIGAMAAMLRADDAARALPSPPPPPPVLWRTNERLAGECHEPYEFLLAPMSGDEAAAVAWLDSEAGRAWREGALMVSLVSVATVSD